MLCLQCMEETDVRVSPMIVRLKARMATVRMIPAVLDLVEGPPLSLSIQPAVHWRDVSLGHTSSQIFSCNHISASDRSA